MKLNNDCIRDILLYLEKILDIKDEEGYTVILPIENVIDYFKNKYMEKEIVYTIDRMNEGNLILCCYSDDTVESIIEITYNGYLHLDNIRDNQIWNSIKNKTKGVASVSFGIMIELAKEEIKQKLN